MLRQHLLVVALSCTHALQMAVPGASVGISRPFFIGVGGASASGKTCVVDEIVRLLDHESVAAITQDAFYKSLTVEQREQAYNSNYNFDHPHAYDFDHQVRVLQQLRDGARQVSVPTYDFTTHSRLGTEHDRVVVMPEIVIFEGILALHDERVRDLFDLKLFVDTDADLRLSRRIKRDMASRGRDLQGILEQHEKFVKPSTDAFCLPSKKHADMILPRGAENAVAIELVAQHINGVLVARELEAEALFS